jgi:hypothetical protein
MEATFSRETPVDIQQPTWRYTAEVGRNIAEAVSHWLLTAKARVRALVWSCGICDVQSGAGVGFLKVLRFPLSIFIPRIVSESLSSII